MQLLVDHYASPLGEIVLVCDRERRLRALDFGDYWPRTERLLQVHYGEHALQKAAAPDEIRSALAAYFAGALGMLRGRCAAQALAA
jgi:methylated-DNA-[protein]-cysteine S-methyltransferase